MLMCTHVYTHNNNNSNKLLKGKTEKGKYSYPYLSIYQRHQGISSQGLFHKWDLVT